MVTDYYLPTLGGVQTLVKAHKEALEQAGHQVTVFCPQHRNSQLPDPTVVALPTSGVFRPDGYPFTWSPQETTTFLAEQFTARSVDVVHVHSEMVAALGGLLAARQLGIPSVQTMHGRVDVYTKNVLPLPELSTRFLARIHHKRIPHSGAAVQDSQHYTATPLARRMWRLMVAQANFADQVIVPSQHFADKLLTQGVTSPLTVLSNGLEDSVLEAIGPAKVRSYEPGTEFRFTWCGRVSPERRPPPWSRRLGKWWGTSSRKCSVTGWQLNKWRSRLGGRGWPSGCGVTCWQCAGGGFASSKRHCPSGKPAGQRAATAGGHECCSNCAPIPNFSANTPRRAAAGLSGCACRARVIYRTGPEI